MFNKSAVLIPFLILLAIKVNVVFTQIESAVVEVPNCNRISIEVFPDNLNYDSTYSFSNYERIRLYFYPVLKSDGKRDDFKKTEIYIRRIIKNISIKNVDTLEIYFNHVHVVPAEIFQWKNIKTLLLQNSIVDMTKLKVLIEDDNSEYSNFNELFLVGNTMVDLEVLNKLSVNKLNIYSYDNIMFKGDNNSISSINIGQSRKHSNKLKKISNTFKDVTLCILPLNVFDLPSFYPSDKYFQKGRL